MSKFIHALTGGIAGGKSSIAKLLEGNGYTVLYADIIAKELLYNPPHITRTKRVLGEDILKEDGQPNIPLIRQRLFESKSLQENLNILTRAVVIPEIIKRAEKVQTEPCFVEMALLFEFYGKKVWQKHFTGSIAICCDEATAIARMKIRNPDISESQAKAILSTQLPYKTKLEWADLSLDTTKMEQREYQAWVDANWPKIEINSGATV